MCVYVCFTKLCWFTMLFALCWSFMRDDEARGVKSRELWPAKDDVISQGFDGSS